MTDLRRVSAIDEASLARLKLIGIHSTDTLLIRAANASGRRAVAVLAELDETKLLAWVNLADLLRVKGVGLQHMQLLLTCNVECVACLAGSDPDALLNTMRRAHAQHPTVRQLPRLLTLREWIAHARGLKPRVM